MGRQLFGTDGIRGVAGEYPLDPKTVFAVGVALGRWAVQIHGVDTTILIGMDTRESGPFIAGQVAAGIEQSGARVRFAGLITTPGVAHLTRNGNFVAGVMISASHNPYQDNGIKVFDHSGFKLPDSVEHAIEGDIFRLLSGDLEPASVGLEPDPGLDEQYLAYLAGTFRHKLDGLHLVVDCANGAAVHLAPALFERLGARVTAINCAPDGRNINLNCGALHLEKLRDAVLAADADAGVAFDGDADRCMFVSHSGKLVDGDAMLLITGLAANALNELTDGDGVPTIVATVMSNMGFEVALKKRGIRMLRTGVGDKYVLEEMIRRGAWLGGEQSGHVIFRRFATTGDGMLTALRVLEVMRQSGQDLDALTADLRVFPQELINIRVKDKRPIEELLEVQGEIQAAMQAFNGNGRVLVRYSGTESLARVMVEGPEPEPVSHFANRIAEAMKRELGT